MFCCRYFGVTALAQIVQDHPSYAGPHQMIVLDCLEDPDETIQRRTLDLLYRMTTPKNVKVVVSKMQAFLKKSKDQFLRKELVQRLTQLAERFAPDATWSVMFARGGKCTRAWVERCGWWFVAARSSACFFCPEFVVHARLLLAG